MSLDKTPVDYLVPNRVNDNEFQSMLEYSLNNYCFTLIIFENLGDPKSCQDLDKLRFDMYALKADYLSAIPARYLYKSPNPKALINNDIGFIPTLASAIPIVLIAMTTTGFFPFPQAACPTKTPNPKVLINNDVVTILASAIIIALIVTTVITGFLPQAACPTKSPNSQVPFKDSSKGGNPVVGIINPG